MKNLDWENINSPLVLESIVGRVFDNGRYTGQNAQLGFGQNGRFEMNGQHRGGVRLTLPNDILILPGRIDIHVHGRDCYDIKPGDKGDQTHKEDSHTLSLALAQGGATRAMCMPNLANTITNNEEYIKQRNWINAQNFYRPAPIMPLGQYVLIKNGTRPLSIPAMYKMMWNTFGPANLEKDEDVRTVLANYRRPRQGPRYWVTAHCETIAGMINNAALPHHEQRPKQAAIDAVQLFLDCAQEFDFHPHIAHISSPEEVELVKKYNKKNAKYGRQATCEVTPQSLWLSHEDFEQQTGLPIKYCQQNPPLRTRADALGLQQLLKEGSIDLLATDHAPHTRAEKDNGMSGMTQAPTAGQAYLELVTKGVLSLEQYVHVASTMPGAILDKVLGNRTGLIGDGYEGSLTLVSLNKKSRISHEDVLSKCGWTPYHNHTWSNTIEGVVVNGKLYTQDALQSLRQRAA